MTTSSRSSAGAPSFPLLVWDMGPNEKILLKAFFLKCIEHQIEARPLINLLSTISANGSVALDKMTSVEPKLFSITHSPSMKSQALEEIQAAMSSTCSARLIIDECLALYREAARERSSTSTSNGG